MPVDSMNAKDHQIVPPKGKRVIEYVGRFVGSTGAVDTARSSQGITCGSPTAGVYVVTLPGKGSMTFMHASGSVVDAANELIGVVNVASADESARTVTFEHFEEVAGTLAGTNLAATEDLCVRILVAQL